MVFNSNDRICFFGDSITAAGDWIEMISDYFIDNRREQQLLPFNCGVPGDNATNALKRIYCDCLQYFPQHVVVMFGMNDICRDLYGDCFSDGENERSRNSALEKYRSSLEQLFSILAQFGTHIIACTPTLYDEIQDIPAENLRHCNDGLLKCRDIVLTLAEERDIDVVDFSGKWLEMRQSQPEMVIVNSDRVHPNREGHRIMAETFLRSCGFAEENQPITFSEHKSNTERRRVEGVLRTLSFAQWMLFGGINSGWEESHEEKKRIFSEIEAKGGEWEKSIHQAYEDNQSTIDILRGELLRKTVAMYAESSQAILKAL